MSKYKATKINKGTPKRKIDIPESAASAYKEKFFNWSINTDYLCKKSECGTTCKDGCFSFYELATGELFKILEKLNKYRMFQWKQMESPRIFAPYGAVSCHKMPISELTTRKMIEKHFLDHRLDYDELYQIEATGKQRIWGIRKDDVLYLLWNDPNHSFYKTEPRNT
jgi:hypothetical protein